MSTISKFNGIMTLESGLSFNPQVIEAFKLHPFFFVRKDREKRAVFYDAVDFTPFWMTSPIVKVEKYENGYMLIATQNHNYHLTIFVPKEETITLEKFLQETNNLIKRPRVICKDGYSVSIQANYYCYCLPRENNAIYEEVELGFPSEADELILEYAEDTYSPKDTVYGFVPVAVVKQLLEKHGGIVSFNKQSL